MAKLITTKVKSVCFWPIQSLILFVKCVTHCAHKKLTKSSSSRACASFFFFKLIYPLFRVLNSLQLSNPLSHINCVDHKNNPSNFLQYIKKQTFPLKVYHNSLHLGQHFEGKNELFVSVPNYKSEHIHCLSGSNSQYFVP